MNTINIQKLEYISANGVKYIKVTGTETAKAGMIGATVAVRNVFEPSELTSQNNKNLWDGLMEVLGTESEVKPNGIQMLGSIARINLPAHYQVTGKDSRGNKVYREYTTGDNKGQKMPSTGFTTFILDWETVESVTEQQRRRIDPEDLVGGSDDID